MCAARMLTRLPACVHRWHGACEACRLLWACVVPRADNGWRGLCPGRVAAGSGTSCPFMFASIVQPPLGFILASLVHSDSLSQLRSQFKTLKKSLFSPFGGVGCVACPRPSAIGHKCKTMPNPRRSTSPPGCFLDFDAAAGSARIPAPKSAGISVVFTCSDDRRPARRGMRIATLRPSQNSPGPFVFLSFPRRPGT